MQVQVKKVPAAATQHIVDEVANSNPEVFKPNGVQDDYAVLMYLGFDIRNSLHNKKLIINQKVEVGFEQYNVECQYNALIRSTQYPRKCYRTRVYKGYVRNAALVDQSGVDEKGRPILLDKRKLHHLADTYEQVGVLQASNLDNHVQESDMIDLIIENFKAQ